MEPLVSLTHGSGCIYSGGAPSDGMAVCLVTLESGGGELGSHTLTDVVASETDVTPANTRIKTSSFQGSSVLRSLISLNINTCRAIVK